MSFPGGSVSKESACNAGDPGLIPGLGRPPGEGNGNPFQYSWILQDSPWRIPWTEDHRVTRIRHDLVTKPSPKISHPLFMLLEISQSIFKTLF